MLTKKQVIPVVLVCLSLGLSSLSFGQDQSQSAMAGSTMKEGAAGQMTPEMRKDLADMYQKMADCLKTGKSSEDCQHQIAKACPVLAKTGRCSLLLGMEHMKGRSAMRQGSNGP
jgi:hypothetical protein